MVQACVDETNNKNPYGLLKTDTCQKPKNRRSQVQIDFRNSNKQLVDLLKEIRQEEKQRQEKEEIRKIRDQMEFKANPIRHFRQVTIQPSSLPLTIPVSPNLQTDKRSRTRSLHPCMKLN